MNDRQRELAVDILTRLLLDIDNDSNEHDYSGFDGYRTPMQMRGLARRIIEEIEEKAGL